MNLASFTRPEWIFLNLPADSGEDVLRGFSGRLAHAEVVADGDGLLQKLQEREGLCSTGIGQGIAIPHCKMERMEKPVLSVATVQEGIDFGAMDDQPVRLFFLVISPGDNPADHLQLLSGIAKWIKASHEEVETILASGSAHQVFELLGKDPEAGAP